MILRAGGDRLRLTTLISQWTPHIRTIPHKKWYALHAVVYHADVKQVFRDVGVDVIEAAMAGYNACLFAYGQVTLYYTIVHILLDAFFL